MGGFNWKRIAVTSACHTCMIDRDFDYPWNISSFSLLVISFSILVLILQSSFLICVNDVSKSELIQLYSTMSDALEAINSGFEKPSKS